MNADKQPPLAVKTSLSGPARGAVYGFVISTVVMVALTMLEPFGKNEIGLNADYLGDSAKCLFLGWFVGVPVGALVGILGLKH